MDLFCTVTLGMKNTPQGWERVKGMSGTIISLLPEQELVAPQGRLELNTAIQLAAECGFLQLYSMVSCSASSRISLLGQVHKLRGHGGVGNKTLLAVNASLQGSLIETPLVSPEVQENYA